MMNDKNGEARCLYLLQDAHGYHSRCTNEPVRFGLCEAHAYQLYGDKVN